MIYIQRRETFCAAHRLHRPEWTNERNREVFGKCAHENYHGHNYVLLVTVKGQINPETGMVMNFTDLKRIVRHQIIDVLDHRNLNVDIPWLLNKMTTAEVMVQEIWNILSPEIEKFGAALHCVRLEETESNYAEYYGE